MACGAGARALRELPFVGALATAAQAEAIAEAPGVVRVTRDEELEYHGGGSAVLASLLAMLERSVPTIQESADPMDEYQAHEVGAGMVNALKAVARSRR